MSSNAPKTIKVSVCAHCGEAGYDQYDTDWALDHNENGDETCVGEPYDDIRWLTYHLEHEPVLDAAALDALPDDTLVIATGRYRDGGTFTQCWARPVPQHITGAAEPRLWEVLVFGSSILMVTATDMTYPVTILHTKEGPQE